jgi:hypothetical protein
MVRSVVRLNLLLSVCCVAASSSVFAGKTGPRKADLGPGWKKRQVNQWDPNLSFLNNLNFKQPAETFLARELMDPSSAGRIQSQYEVLSRDYELRQNYGLLSQQDHQNQSGQMIELRKQAMNEVREFQKKRQGEKILGAIQRDEDLRRPVSVAVAVASAVTGAPYQAQLGESAQVTMSANLPFQTSYIQLHSSLLDGSISAVGDPSAGNALTLAPPDWVNRKERYRFSLSRSLPMWGLGSEVAYGGSSNTFTASLSKSVTESLKCSVNTIQPASPLSSASSEQTLNLDYKLHF